MKIATAIARGAVTSAACASMPSAWAQSCSVSVIKEKNADLSLAGIAGRQLYRADEQNIMA